MQTSKKITIAIDGFSSCGKSTLAKALAEKLGYIFIDSGAMYRAVALYAFQNKWISDSHFEKEKLIENLPNIQLHFELNSSTQKPEIYLNNQNVAAEIREITVSSLVSKVASIKEVRQKLVAEQREMGKKGGVVMDGRDIGSVVFPQAELKLFVTAKPEIRAQRRFLELKATDPNITLEEIENNLTERDEMDSSRDESPLIQTNDAVLLDNSDLNPAEQLEIAYGLVLERLR
ncbi:MAG: (d)CMP kinase [Crocinitomicaceae bacterium]|nr:(d)CMP kinase [Crocinitomicaceae bacterium]